MRWETLYESRTKGKPKKTEAERKESLKAYQKEYQQKRRKRLISLGLCISCGKNRAEGTLCSECAEKRRLQKKEPAKKRAAKKSIDEIALAARAAGMSYGKYVAMMEMKGEKV